MFIWETVTWSVSQINSVMTRGEDVSVPKTTFLAKGVSYLHFVSSSPAAIGIPVVVGAYVFISIKTQTFHKYAIYDPYFDAKPYTKHVNYRRRRLNGPDNSDRIKCPLEQIVCSLMYHRLFIVQPQFFILQYTATDILRRVLTTI